MFVVKKYPNGEYTVHWEHRDKPRVHFYEIGEWHAMCVGRFFVAIYDYAEGFALYPWREWRRKTR